MKTYLIIFEYDPDEPGERNILHQIEAYTKKLEGTEWPSTNVCTIPEDKFSALLHRLAVIVHQEAQKGHVAFAYKYLSFSESFQWIHSRDFPPA